jgi:hypothetical protein
MGDGEMGRWEMGRWGDGEKGDCVNFCLRSFNFKIQDSDFGLLTYLPDDAVRQVQSNLEPRISNIEHPQSHIAHSPIAHLF